MYHVSATGLALVMIYDVLNMYYHRYKEENILFMVFDRAKIGELVCVEDIFVIISGKNLYATYLIVFIYIVYRPLS